MSGPSNKAIAGALKEIETLMLVLGWDDRRALHYGASSRRVEEHAEPLAEMEPSDWTNIKGIGPKMQALIGELLQTGTIAMRDDLAEQAGAGVIEMLRIRGFGAKKIHALTRELGVRSPAELRAAAADGRVAALSGFGPKSAQKILEGLEYLEQTRGRLRISTAAELGERWIAQLGLSDAHIAGPVRRGEPVIDRLAIVCAGQPQDPGLPGAELQGDTLVVPAAEHPELRLRWTDAAGLARVLFEETGPADHVEAVLGRAGSDASEEEIYTSRGLHFVPPERRHARDGSEPVPALVTREQLKGMVHTHTTWSDGTLSVAEMATEAAARGYEYLVITDHSPVAVYANGLSIERLQEQAAEIRELNRSSSIRILHGTEVDILPDGALDYPDEVLAELDCVIASIHSVFTQDAGTITERVLRAVRHPHVDILGHATGRLVLRRDGYAVDMQRVLDAAAEAGTLVELNASPWRLDLAPELHARAQELAIGVPIGPDAHSAAGMDDNRWGVAAARHGGLRPEDVPNCGDVDAFLGALKQ